MIKIWFDLITNLGACATNQRKIDKLHYLISKFKLGFIWAFASGGCQILNLGNFAIVELTILGNLCSYSHQLRTIS